MNRLADTPSPMDRSTDASLIERILAGDRDLYTLLVRRYQAALYRYAHGMSGDPDISADLVQETLVRAYTSLDRCRDPDRFGAWVFQILRNRYRDYVKAPNRRVVPLAEGDLVTSGADSLRALEQRETAARIEEALASLPESRREAFLLKYVEELSYEEMSERLGVGISALKMRVSRAREELHAALAEQKSEMM